MTHSHYEADPHHGSPTYLGAHRLGHVHYRGQGEHFLLDIFSHKGYTDMCLKNVSHHNGTLSSVWCWQCTHTRSRNTVPDPIHPSTFELQLNNQKLLKQLNRFSSEIQLNRKSNIIQGSFRRR